VLLAILLARMGFQKHARMIASARCAAKEGRSVLHASLVIPPQEFHSLALQKIDCSLISMPQLRNFG